ncbi:MAG: hypothetical protein AAB332_03640, partial [Planctomycetota bacterium]
FFMQAGSLRYFSAGSILQIEPQRFALSRRAGTGQDNAKVGNTHHKEIKKNKQPLHQVRHGFNRARLKIRIKQTRPYLITTTSLATCIARF